MFKFIMNLDCVLLGLNCVLFTFFTKAKNIPGLYWFVRYMWCMVAVQFVAWLHARLGIHNIYLSHFYFVLQFVTLSLFYKQLLKKALVKKFIQWLLVGVLVFLIVQYVCNTNLIFKFNIPEILFCSISLSLYAVFYLYQSIAILNRRWLFLSAGLLLYLLSSVLVFSGGNLFLDKIIKTTKISMNDLWILNNIVYLIYQLIILIEWYENFRKNNTQSK